MAKQYGLILPGKVRKPVSKTSEVTKPSLFDESDSDDDEKFYEPPTKKDTAMSMMERRTARRLQEKALEEDPTVFQYDELYDEMELQRKDEKNKKSQEPKKPKYIGRLIQYAERRKLENELRIERQVQKDREQEGEEFKDKESFVTEAYKKKLEERRKLEEQEKREEYLEAIGDVTRQKDLDGFYRHLYEQKLGTDKEVTKPEPTPVTKAEDTETSYKPIKSGKPKKRAYRKRQASVEEEETPIETKKVHLQNNIDADSDFSIDSSSDDVDDDDSKDGAPREQQKKKVDSNATNPKQEPSYNAKIAINFDTLKKDTESQVPSTDENKLNSAIELSEQPKPKIWEKRTVGVVFEEAVKRFFERRAARNA